MSTTTEQRIRAFLEERGLFGSQTDAVIQRVKAVPEVATLSFNDRDDAYPKAMLAVLFLTAQRCAIEWMDAECPQHFARSLFQQGAGAAAS